MTTDEELAVLKHLARAWDQYLALLEKHPGERRDFMDAIHRAQDLIAVRVARRADPENWPSYPRAIGM